MAPVQQEAAGGNRRKRGLGDGNPVGVGKRLQHRRADTGPQSEQGTLDRGPLHLAVIVSLDEIAALRLLE